VGCRGRTLKDETQDDTTMSCALHPTGVIRAVAEEAELRAKRTPDVRAAHGGTDTAADLRGGSWPRKLETRSRGSGIS